MYEGSSFGPTQPTNCHCRNETRGDHSFVVSVCFNGVTLQQGDLIRFELTQQKLEGLLEQVDAIEQAITTHSQS